MILIAEKSRTQLAESLAVLSKDASALPDQIPPEIIDYVDSGRNPDIYTREFIELVQKSNQYLKGRSEALTGFRDVLAEEMVKGWPEMKTDVDNVLEGSNIELTREKKLAEQTNGTSS